MTDKGNSDSEKQHAYNAALNELKKIHQDEYRKLIEAEFEARGLTYKPRLTAFDRARQQIIAWVAEYGTDVLPHDQGPLTEDFEEEPMFP